MKEKKITKNYDWFEIILGDLLKVFPRVAARAGTFKLKHSELSSVEGVLHPLGYEDPLLVIV